MFKKSLLALTCFGLMAGSAQAHHPETETPKERIIKHIDTLADAIRHENALHEGCLFIAATTATMAFGIIAILTACNNPADYYFLQDAIKLFAASGAIAGYNLFKLNTASRKIVALYNIQRELEKAEAVA